jgi:hypothetical protein
MLDQPQTLLEIMKAVSLAEPRIAFLLGLYAAFPDQVNQDLGVMATQFRGLVHRQPLWHHYPGVTTRAVRTMSRPLENVAFLESQLKEVAAA